MIYLLLGLAQTLSAATAWLELTLSDRIVVESFAECRALGRFALRRSGDTIAIGVIDETF